MKGLFGRQLCLENHLRASETPADIVILQVALGRDFLLHNLDTKCFRAQPPSGDCDAAIVQSANKGLRKKSPW